MNKKRYLLLGLLIVLAAAVRLPAQAASTSYSDFQMKGSTLVKYTGKASVVSIPTTVKIIGKEAFSGHTELVRVDMPAYMEGIEYNAFEGCTSLKKIMIPDTVTKVGNGAFSGCSSLKSVTLGKKLKKLGSGVFAECVSLDTANVHKDNTNFSYDSGVIYDKEKTTAHVMLPGYDSGTYMMPQSVKKISPSAFWGCMKLTKVEIGGNAKEIPDYAFSNCANLETVKVSYSVNRIGLKAFSDCTNLKDVEIPESVQSIHKTAFDGCPSLNIIAEPGSKAEEFVKEQEALDKTKSSDQNEAAKS